MSKLYLEIFDLKRKKVFKQLDLFKRDGYLAGGTALALQLGHRKSFDFDIFIPQEISRRFVKKVLNIFGKEITPRVNTADILIFESGDGVEINFVYYWYQSLAKRIKTESIDLSAIKDIAADKAYTIGRRGEWRDYVDIFTLIKRDFFSLEQIIKLASKKYPGEFSPRLFLEQLSYFGDIPDFEITFCRETYSVAEIKNFLFKASKKFIKQSFGKRNLLF